MGAGLAGGGDTSGLISGGISAVFEVVGGCSGVVVIASPVVVIVVFSFTAVVSRINQNDKHVNNLIFKE